MGVPHKHAAIIKAWADGAEIQYMYEQEWIDFPNNNLSPCWDPRWQYRIKPKPPVKKYHYAYENLKSQKQVTIAMYQNDEEFFEYSGYDESTLKWFQRIDNSVKEFEAK